MHTDSTLSLSLSHLVLQLGVTGAGWVRVSPSNLPRIRLLGGGCGRGGGGASGLVGGSILRLEGGVVVGGGASWELVQRVVGSSGHSGS